MWAKKQLLFLLIYTHTVKTKRLHAPRLKILLVFPHLLVALYSFAKSVGASALKQSVIKRFISEFQCVNFTEGTIIIYTNNLVPSIPHQCQSLYGRNQLPGTNTFSPKGSLETQDNNWWKSWRQQVPKYIYPTINEIYITMTWKAV